MIRVKRSIDVYTDPTDPSPVVAERGDTCAWLTVMLDDLDIINLFVAPTHLRALAQQCERIADSFDAVPVAAAVGE